MATEGKRLNLVCVDDSEHSERGFNWYVENYHKEDDIVGLAHVHNMPSLPAMGLMAGGVPLTDEYHKSIERSVLQAKAVKSKFEKLCKDKGLKYQFFMTDSHQSPGHMLVGLAKDKKASAIIVGQRGLGTISRKLLGSTSDYVLHHAHVPVMVVPNPKH